MRKDCSKLQKILSEGITQKVFSNCAVSVGNRTGELYQYCIDDGNKKTDKNTLFDMASVTKIISTTMITMALVEKNSLTLDDTLGDFFDCPDDKKQITLKQLLTHTAGFSASYDIGNDAKTPENVLQAILKKPLVLPVGKDVFYSCPGFIVLGKVLESVERKTLDVLCEKYVLSPLEMHHTCYCPKDSNIACSNTNVDLTGIVNDNNARFMGGVSGNAGLFSSISDMSKFAVMLANRGEKVISKGLFTKAIECYTKGLSESRGLGFNLVDSRYGQTGELFGLYSYGHTGYTGTSVFVDRETDLTVVLLTNRTHFDLDYSVFQGYRAKIHNAIRGEFI